VWINFHDGLFFNFFAWIYFLAHLPFVIQLSIELIKNEYL